MTTTFDETQSKIEAPQLLRAPEEIEYPGLDPETSMPVAFVSDGNHLYADFVVGGMEWRLHIGYEADGQTVKYQLGCLPPAGHRLSQQVDCKGTVKLSG